MPKESKVYTVAVMLEVRTTATEGATETALIAELNRAVGKVAAYTASGTPVELVSAKATV